MTKQETLERIRALGLLAVIRGPSPNLTFKMVDALVAGGVQGIEVTYLTPNAEWVVDTLAQKYGDQILLGIGTLTDPRQAVLAKAAGARFLVSPICEPELVRAMVASQLVVMAGAFSPTEVFQAFRLGSDVVEVYSSSLVGPGYIRALREPFPYIPMMPMGGVSAANIGEWFAAGAVAVGAGSELCPPALVKEGNFDEIARRAAEFVRAVNAARAVTA